MSQWEYWIERFSSSEDVPAYNALGAEGWELVAVDHGARLAWFKRATAAEPPAVVTAPYVGATSLAVGGLANCTMGTWANEPRAYAYQWLRNETPISDQTANSYTMVAADVGFSLSCMVTATNSYGEASATSNAIGPVV
jgi:hypothetical protein